MNIEEMTLKIRADFSEVQNIGDRIAAEFRKVKEAISKASEAGDDLQRRARRMGQSMDQAARASQSSMGKAAQSTTTFGRKLENLKRRILDIARSSSTVNKIWVQFRKVGNMASSAASTMRSGFGRISGVLTSVKNKISELIQKIRSIGKESRNAGNQASRNIDQIGNSATRAANQANTGFGRLSGILKGGLAIFLGGKAIQAITQFGKSCIDLGSDLAEVQNVVDTTFPHMSAQIDQFSKSAIEQFGLSETVAKNYSSTFGAMARAFGFSEKEAYNMGTALTGLSGDVASFYNISTDEAYTKLKSVFTGETETLKDLGVVMTQNALDQYALQNGYAKTTAQMTEQEKVALRLAFVQEKLSLASGDFAKTSDSWANQVRVLKLRFDSLKATLGQGLINILTPVVKIINSIVARLSVLAEAFLRFTEMITGKKAQSNPVGNVASDMNAATDSTNDYTDAANGAGDAASKSANKAEAAAKKIQRSVMGFDKLNKLNEKPKSDSGSTGSGGAGGAGVGGAGLTDAMNGALNETEAQTSAALERIKRLWDEIRTTFMKGFTIGVGDLSVLDDIKESLGSIKKSFGEIFGDSEVQAAVGRFAQSLVFNLGKVAGSCASIGLTIADNLLGGLALYLQENTERIKQYIINMFDIGSSIADIAGNFTVAVADIFSVFRGDTAKQCTADIIAIFTNAAMGLTEILARFGRDILDLITGPIIDNKDKIKEAVENTLQPISTILGTFKTLVNDVFDIFRKVYDEKIGPAFQKIKEGFTTLVDVFLAVYNENIAPILQAFADDFDKTYKEYIRPAISGILELFGDLAEGIGDIWNTLLVPLISWFAKTFGPVISSNLSNIGKVFNTFVRIVSKAIETVTGILRGIVEFVSGVLTGKWDKAWRGIKRIFKTVWESFKGIVKKPVNAIIGFINGMISAVATGVNSIARMLNKLNVKAPKWVTKATGITSIGFNLPTWSPAKIPYLAKGGLPETGQLFVANEDGPEMLGKMGRQNVVANNNQITTGIRNAVVDAMVQVMMNNSSNEERQINVENKFVVDSETFYRMTQKGKLKADRRYHVVSNM